MQNEKNILKHPETEKPQRVNISKTNKSQIVSSL